MAFSYSPKSLEVYVVRHTILKRHFRPRGSALNLDYFCINTEFKLPSSKGWSVFFSVFTAVSFTLFRNTVAQHCSKNKIFFGRKSVKRFVAKLLYNFDALFFSKKDIIPVIVDRTNKIGNLICLQFFSCQFKAFFRQCAESHTTNALAAFVYLMKKDSQFFHVFKSYRFKEAA